jgi:hypothetical protein
MALVKCHSKHFTSGLIGTQPEFSPKTGHAVGSQCMKRRKQKADKRVCVCVLQGYERDISQQVA